MCKEIGLSTIHTILCVMVVISYRTCVMRCGCLSPIACVRTVVRAPHTVCNGSDNHQTCVMMALFESNIAGV